MVAPSATTVPSYPTSWPAFHAMFPDEDACRRYLEGLRWPDGFVCPSCGPATGYRTRRHKVKCARCRRETTVTAGTVFADTRAPLLIWFQAAWLVSSQRTGVSARTLQETLGLGSYRQAWAMLHKLLRAMVVAGRTQLVGPVEVDETWVGGSESGNGARGRLTFTKSIVAIAVESRGAGSGRVCLAHVPNTTGLTLVGFVRNTVTAGADVHTDANAAYNGLRAAGYARRVTNMSASPDPADVAMPRVHRVASLLKRWLLGTHQGGVRRQHLETYLDEFVFRYNRRGSRDRGWLFYRLLQNALATPPTPFRSIVGNTRPRAVRMQRAVALPFIIAVLARRQTALRGAAPAPPPPLLTATPAVACALHPGAPTRCFGTYTSAGVRRQRFECLAPDGRRAHTFTAPAP